MSAPLDPPVPMPDRQCPTSVVVATRVLAAMALLLVAEMLSCAYELVTIRSTVHRLGPGLGASRADMDKLAGDITSVVVLWLAALFFFVAFATLAAVYARLGRRVGQLIGIAIAVPLLTCLPANYIPAGNTKFESAVLNAQPGWVDAIDLAALAVTPMAIVVIVLLLTRSARAFFAVLPPAPSGYMWVPTQLASEDWSRWPAQGPHDQR